MYVCMYVIMYVCMYVCMYGPAHPQLPPTLLQGAISEVDVVADPACLRQGLVDALLALDEPDCAGLRGTSVCPSRLPAGLGRA